MTPRTNRLGERLSSTLRWQKTGANDRRQRLLYLTDKGRALEQDLTSEQRARLTAAFREAGAEAVAGFRKVMLGAMNPESRRHFESS